MGPPTVVTSTATAADSVLACRHYPHRRSTMAEGRRPRALASGLRGAGGFFDPARVELEKAGVELVMSDFRTPEELLAAARDVEGIFESAVHYSRDVLSQLPNL